MSLRRTVIGTGHLSEVDATNRRRERADVERWRAAGGTSRAMRRP